MKKIILLCPLLFICPLLKSQDEMTATFRDLYELQNYNKIIDYKVKDDALPAEALYYKGMAYYMKQDDAHALKYLDAAINKGPADADMYYYKGMEYYYTGKYKESLPLFDKAIAMQPEEPDFYSGKGEAYSSLMNNDSAIAYFKKATGFEQCAPRSFLMLGALYNDEHKNEEALAAYLSALPKLSANDESYQNCSFNIGLLQLLTEKYTDAQTTLEKHIAVFPDDYHAMAKLMQAYYGTKEYDKAKPYRDQLYAAHKKGLLKENMKDMFCYDQFKWKDKTIQAYERYEDDPKKDYYNKHIFYVLNEKGDIDFRIQTEYSAVSVELGGAKYLLCMSKGNSHSTFNIGFNDDFKYDDLKNAVISVLEEKIKPGATSTPGN